MCHRLPSVFATLQYWSCNRGKCNVANNPFVLCSVEKRTLALVLADGSSCKALKIRYCRLFSPFHSPVCFESCRIATLHLFCFCFFKSERSLSQQTPALHIRFLFPKNRERSVTLPTCFQIYCSIYASLKYTAYMGAWVSPFLCTITIVWWFLTVLGTWA